MKPRSSIPLAAASPQQAPAFQHPANGSVGSDWAFGTGFG